MGRDRELTGLSAPDLKTEVIPVDTNIQTGTQGRENTRGLWEPEVQGQNCYADLETKVMKHCS